MVSLKVSSPRSSSQLQSVNPSHNQTFNMKLVLLLVIVGFAAFFEVTDARMSAFACADCFSYDNGPFCISNGSVVCDNCKRDAMLCADTSLSSQGCNDQCD